MYLGWWCHTASATPALIYSSLLSWLSLLLGISHANAMRHRLPWSSLPQSSQAVPITASTSSVREHRLTEAAAGSRLTTSAKALASSFLGRVGKVPVEANTEVLDTGVSLTSHFNMSLTGKRESVPCGGEEQSQGGGRTEAGCRRMDCLLQTLIVLRSRCFLPRFKRSCCSEKDSRESIASSEGAYSGREICLLPRQGKVTCPTLC